MQFDKPMLAGTLLKRYKRFLADIELEDGRVITAHCANSGAMTSCAEPGQPVLVSDSQNPKRKLKYTWEMIRMNRTWVGVNTARPNAVVAHYISQGKIPELLGYSSLRREVTYGREGRSRIDILLSNDNAQPCYVEVKNATMKVGHEAAFPDAVTTRGRKHLDELAYMVSQGARAVMFFFVGRNDCTGFRPADEIDADYGAALRNAEASGVELLAYRVRFSPKQVSLGQPVPISL